MKKFLTILFLAFTAVSFAQSTHLIPVNRDDVFDRNGRRGKSLVGLFDADLATSLDLNGANENVFVLPYSSFIVLPFAIYSNLKIEYYDLYGSTGYFPLNLYDSNRTLIRRDTLDNVSGFGVWQTKNIASATKIRFIEVALANSTQLNTGIYELKIYGDSVAPAAPIFPGREPIKHTDPGAFANGGNMLDDRMRQYNVSDITDTLVSRMHKSVRVGKEAIRYSSYPDSYTDSLQYSPFNLDRFQTDEVNVRVLNYARRHQLNVQEYQVGGSLKNLSFAAAAASNHTYNTVPNLFKHIEPGSDSTVEANWKGWAEVAYIKTALYGRNRDADLTGKTITNGNTSAGQGGMQVVEMGNELSKDWQGATAFHSPMVIYPLQRAVDTRIKQADPTMKSYVPALTYFDTTNLRAMGFEHFWRHGRSESFPADGFNANLYMNNRRDGQEGDTASYGLSPERWQYLPRLQQIHRLFDKWFPGKSFVLSEFGYATLSASPYNVTAIGSKTAAQVAADLTLRVKALTQAEPFVEAIYHYAFYNDGTNEFGTMAETEQDLTGPGGSYKGNTINAVGYALINELAVESPYNFYSTIITNGDSTGAWVTAKNATANSIKKLFKVWMGTSNGSVHTTVVPVGANAKLATLYTLNYSGYTPSSSSLTIANNTVLVSATEGMQWLEVTYSRPVDTIKIPRYKKLKYKSK